MWREADPLAVTTAAQSVMATSALAETRPRPLLALFARYRPTLPVELRLAFGDHTPLAGKPLDVADTDAVAGTTLSHTL